MASFSQGPIPTLPIKVFVRNNYLSALFLFRISEFRVNVSTKLAKKLLNPAIDFCQLRGLVCLEIH